MGKGTTARQHKKPKRIKKTHRRPISKAQHQAIFSDTEDMLLDLLVKGNNITENGTDIENLLFSISPGTGAMGYTFGFSIGRAISLKLGQGAAISSVLERLGLKNSLYHPFNDKVVITSTERKAHPKPYLGSKVHIYEAGLLSGYLSASTGMPIVASEKRCIYDGSGECQFNAFAVSSKPAYSNIGVENIASAIAYEFTNSHFKKTKNDYHRALAFLPFTDNSISKSILKVMLITGEKIGKSQSNTDMRQVIYNISNYFGIKTAEIETRPKKTIIILKYESYNSTNAFVAMPAAIIVGIAKSRGRKAIVRFTTNGRYYTTSISINGRF